MKHFDADAWYFGGDEGRQNVVDAGVEISQYADDLREMVSSLQPERLAEFQAVVQFCYDAKRR